MRAIHNHRAPRALAIAAMTAIAVASPPTARAQDAHASRLTLGTLYGDVQRLNPRAQAARSLASAASARVPGARRPPDPQFQLGFMNYAVPGLAPMPTLGMQQLQLMQTLPLGGKLSLSGAAADAQASAAAQRAGDAQWNVRTSAAMEFYDLYATDRSLAVARETLRLLEDIAHTAESMYRVGEGRQADVLRAQVEIAKMAEDTLRMQAMRQASAARLNALLDRSADVPVSQPALPLFPDSTPTQSWLNALAADDRPMIRAGLDEVRAADASQQLARKEIIPDLQVGVQYGQRPGDLGGTDRMASLMFGVSIPLFARDRQYRMRDEADAMRQMAEADLKTMRADTRGKIGEVYADLTRARNLATLYRTTVMPEAEATVASALAAYRVGGVDFMTLLDDRMTVNKYRQELYALDADQGKAWAELEMLTGHPLFDANRTAVATALGGDK